MPIELQKKAMVGRCLRGNPAELIATVVVAPSGSKRAATMKANRNRVLVRAAGDLEEEEMTMESSRPTLGGETFPPLLSCASFTVGETESGERRDSYATRRNEPFARSTPSLLRSQPCEATALLRSLIAGERDRRSLQPLRICPSLESLAQIQARYMATSGTVQSAFEDEKELSMALNRGAIFADMDLMRQANKESEERQDEPDCCELLRAGADPLSLHRDTMRNIKGRLTILSSRFTEYGLGVCRGRDGKLYMCQFFRA